MSKFGLIEGFYGKSYDFTSRHELISSMAGTDLNFYLYAPKEDPFLRNNFDLTPNESWQAKFTEFISHAEDCGIDIGVGLTPFKDKHIEKFDLKVNFFANLGCKNISLLFDDLEKINLDKQLNILSKGISEFPEIHFDFCPSVYCNELIEKDLAHNEYFEKFLQNFPTDCCFYWTGEKVISTSISEEVEDRLVGINNSNLIIWDNYFTIDSCPRKLNLTNFNHLDKTYINSKKYYLINMTGMIRTDQLLVSLMANLKSQRSSFEQILSEHGLSDDLIEMIDLFDPLKKINLSERDKKKLHNIMYSWFHPIKNEWYPYLHNLKNWE